MTIELLPPPAGFTPAPDDVRITRAADILEALLSHHPPATDVLATVVPTGIPAFDELGGGLGLGTVTAVVGPPGSRSTRLLLRAALYAAAQERPTLFCALDMPLASLAVSLADVVTGEAVAGSGGAPGEAALRTAVSELAELPLFVEVGTTISIHDVFAVAEDALIDFLVIDNYHLLLPSGSATDLKHCTTDLNVAALTSTTQRSANDDLDIAGLDADLLNAADTIACYNPTEQSCRVVSTRA